MRRFSRTLNLDQQSIVAMLCVAIFIIFTITLPGFSSTGNLFVLIRSVSVLGILGLGMAIVVIGRGIDLSMIATLAVPSALVLTFAEAGYSPVFALFMGICLAISIGILNGVLVAYAEIPALFATLAVGIGVAGVGQSGLFEYDIVAWPPSLDGLAWIGRGRFMGVPYAVITFAISALIVHIFLKKTRLGFFIYALGDNLAAARNSGIRVRPVIILQYVLSSLIALFAGLVLSASASNIDTRIFNLTWIYDVILVVVLGGIGLSGGRGGVMNVIIGTLLIGTIINGMTIMNVSFEGQNLVRGLVLLLALMADSILNPRNEETEKQGDI